MSKIAQYYELTKPRVVALLVFCAVIGMFLAVDASGQRVLPTWHAAVFGTLGIWLASASAAAFNHLIDQRIDQLMARLERNEFDLVAVGRALLNDPDWVSKVRTGDAAGMKPFSPAAMSELL